MDNSFNVTTEAVVRCAAYEEIKQIKEVANAHRYTSHFSFPGFSNKERFANGDILVAILDGHVVGFCVLSIRKVHRTTEIEIIGVHPSYKGHGVGKALLDYVCKNQRNGVLMLAVHKDNDALGFYERYGFKKITEVMDGKCYAMRYVIKGRGVIF